MKLWGKTRNNCNEKSFTKRNVTTSAGEDLFLLRRSSKPSVNLLIRASLAVSAAARDPQWHDQRNLADVMKWPDIGMLLMTT